MKKLFKPIHGKGQICPRFFQGTLNEKYQELLRVQKRIEDISANPDTSPSEKLLDERGELEIEIDRHLVDGEKLEDAFMDYCLRHFNGGTTHSINCERVRKPSVFDIIQRVRSFMDYVISHGDEKILSTYDDTPTQLGIISGECKFTVEDSYRYLSVPVKQLWAFDGTSNNWERGQKYYDAKEKKQAINSDLFGVNPEIFSHVGLSLSIFGHGKVWSTDHSRETYIGGPGPKETSIYIGTRDVDVILKQKRTMTVDVPKKTIVVARAPEI